MELTVSEHRSVWQSCGAVTAHSAAAEAMRSDVDMLVSERPAQIGAHAPAILGIVECSRSVRSRRTAAAAEGGSRYIFTREDSVAEAAVDGEEFVMSETGFE